MQILKFGRKRSKYGQKKILSRLSVINYMYADADPEILSKFSQKTLFFKFCSSAVANKVLKSAYITNKMPKKVPNFMLF